MKNRILANIGLLVFGASLAQAQTPLGSAFTYQGKLNDNGSGVDGAADMKFSLWDADAGGNQVGPTLRFDGIGSNGQPITLAHGLFTESLDFGSAAMTSGAARWLNVEVRNPHDPTNSQPYVTLTPRQALTATPAATYSQNTRGLVVDGAGNVGVGTSAPGQKLSVAGIIESMGGGFKFPDGTVQSSAFGPGLIPWAWLTNVPESILHNYNPWVLDTSGPLAAWGYDQGGLNNVPTGQFKAISCGIVHALAIRVDGTLAAWGDNTYGQCNVPSGTYSAVSGGWHYSMALRPDGTVVVWGDLSNGQGNIPPGQYSAIAAGYFHCLALRLDGTVAGWGEDGGWGCTSLPGTYSAIAAADYHSMGLRTDGTLYSVGFDMNWGHNNVPSGVFTTISDSTFNGAAIRPSGALVAWGLGSYGVPNAPAGTFTQVALGDTFGVALRTDGSLATWGTANLGGELNPPTGTFSAIGAGAGFGVAVGGTAKIVASANADLLGTLKVHGTVTSTSGGFVFPDGSTQTTAAPLVLNGWTVSGTNTVTTGSGNIGIGTNSPTEKVEVSNGSLFLNGENRGLIVDSLLKRIGLMKYAGREAGIWRASSQDFEIGRVNTGDVTTGAPTTVDLYVAGNGNVGIGTGSPAEALHVAANAKIGGTLSVGGTMNGAAGVFTESWNGTHLNHSTTATVMQDLPESDEFIQIPAGKAVLTWSMSCWASTVARVNIRPAIGSIVPNGITPFLFNQAAVHQTISGSCALDIPTAMNASVRLQWQSQTTGAQFNVDANDHISWTLTVNRY